jgi:iron complex outermembrane receptor protein
MDEMNYKYYQFAPVRRVIRRGLMAALFSMFVSLNVNGQSSENEQGDEDIIELTPFEVSAEDDAGYQATQTQIGRTAVPLIDLPASVQIITKELLEDLDSKNVIEALKFGTSGVTANQSYFDDLNIRGFRTSNQLRDGASKRAFKKNQVYDVERVEVIKGPGAMLVGQDFLGGAINYITSRPVPIQQGHVQLTLGNRDRIGTKANVTGPLVNKDDVNINYRATIGTLDGDGDTDNEFFEERFFGGALAFNFSNRIQLDVSGYILEDNTYAYFSDFLDITQHPERLVLHPQSGKVAPASQRNSHWATDEIFLAAELKAMLTPNNNLRIFYSYYDHHLNDRLIPRFISVEDDNVTLNRQGIGGGIRSKIHTVNLDYINDLEFEWGKNRFMFGGVVAFEDLKQNASRYDIPDPLPKINVNNPDYSQDDARFDMEPTLNIPGGLGLLQEFENSSYYIQDNLTVLNDQLIFVAGLRWRDAMEHYTRAGESERRPTEKTRSHKYGIVYKPTNWLSLYGTDVVSLIPRNGVLRDTEIPLKDSDFEMQEFGIKANYKTDKGFSVFGSIVYFDMLMTNVPINSVDENNNLIQIQVEGNTSEGFEIDLGARIPAPNGHLELILTYYDADTTTAGTDHEADGAPKSVSSLLAKYVFEEGPLEGLSTGFGVYDQAEKYSRGFYIDYPTTYTLFLTYRLNEDWHFQFNVDNLTDERYIVDYITPGLVDTAEDRSIRFTARYNF